MAVLKMEKLKVFMLKFLFYCFFFISSSLFAKQVEVQTLGKKSDITKDLTADDILTLNGYRQVVTMELEELKLDSKIFWEKLELKKFSSIEEIKFLRALFDNVDVSRSVLSDLIEEAKDEKLEGSLKGELNLEKLKTSFEELKSNLSETKLKTFYLLSNFEIDSSMTWEDTGVADGSRFSGVIVDAWKKLFEKDLKGFEKIIVLEKDFTQKPDYMNTKSLTLKWNSTLKKVSTNIESKKAIFELSAQYILVNTKTGDVLNSFDFPLQKRELDTQNKKSLSSALASLTYNLLLSQSSKIQGIIEADGKGQEQSSLELKISSKAGLSEIYAINNLLQEKFQNIKLTSSMKSYSREGAVLNIRAEGSVDKILDSLSLEGGKFPLNEQKILLFNRTDKSFAILPKDSNN